MTSHALIAELEATGLTQDLIGAQVDVTRQTISNWKHARTHMPQAARMVLAALLKERTKDE